MLIAYCLQMTTYYGDLLTTLEIVDDEELLKIIRNNA